MLGVTVKSAKVLMPFTVTGRVAIPSTIKLVLLTATKGVDDGRRSSGSTSCEGARLTSAPLSSKQLWSWPVMRALTYAAVGAFTGSLAERRTECLAPVLVLRGFPAVTGKGSRVASGRAGYRLGKACAAAVSSPENSAGCPG